MILIDNKHTIKEVCEMLSITDSTCRAMYKKGYRTLKTMLQYRHDIADGKLSGGGTIPALYMTSRGQMTIKDMERAHPFNLSGQLLRNRGERWGYTHKCMWLGVGGTLDFIERATRLDGKPRPCEGRDEVETNQEPEDKEEIAEFSRLHVCYRDRGQMRCKYYFKCQDHRLDNGGRHGQRFEENGSCYDGVPVKPTYLEGQGQHTDKVIRTMCFV